MRSGKCLAKVVFFVSGLMAIQARADSLLIAVASNFAVAAEELVQQFGRETDHDIRISTASTGKLFVQIENGAPFDLLLAADAAAPKRLASKGIGLERSRFTYAIGRLVLWSRDEKIAGTDCRGQLYDLGKRRLAIANPNTAPYGAAARQTLVNLNLWEGVMPSLVMGENIAQTLQFVASGNATLGFVAVSQINDERLPEASCAWVVPVELHQPIEQQAILLTRAENNAAASEFIEYLGSDAGRQIIARHGYLLPGQEQ